MVSVFLFLRHVFKPCNVVVALRNSKGCFFLLNRRWLPCLVVRGIVAVAATVVSIRSSNSWLFLLLRNLQSGAL